MDETPDVYADQFIVTAGVWGVAMSFGKSPPHPTPGQAPQAVPQAVVRMSLEHAKVVSLILRRQLKAWENENGEINVPHAVFNQLGLSPEDW